MEIIHIVLGKANPARMNGVNKVVYQLATNQAKVGKKVSVWGITKDLSVNYDKRPFATVLFQEAKNPFMLAKEFKQQAIGKKGKAIFHLHGGWIPMFSSVARFFSKHEIEYVLTGHGAYNSVAMQKSKILKTIYFHLFEKKLIAGAKKVHSIGISEVNGLDKIYKNAVHFLLPYGYDGKKSTVEVVKGSKFIVGFVGRLTTYTKGLDILLAGYASFRRKNPTCELWIVGDGQDRETLESQVGKEGIKNVKFWGAKYDEEKDGLIKQMHVFAHPSRNEGLPSAVLEAASFGVPSLVSEYTNVGDFVKAYNAGICMALNDAPNLTLGLIELHERYKQNQLRRISENAKAMVEFAFSWENISSQFDELYI
ncbi:MAG: glycosyltransferase involved in cell wall biosynthesis [Marivirga sp.]|jgi:glycosyltransferase involved in cell wall biosynthesis